MKVPDSYIGSRRPRIEMLPLIDIVFLLLVFFIYAMLSMVVHHSIDLSLPDSFTAETDTESHLSVFIRQNGEIIIDNTEVSPGDLVSVLHERSRDAVNGRSLQVDLFADKVISYQELYRVLDSIREAGVADVSLQADTAE